MLFPSEAWLAAVLGVVNRHPDLPRALAGLGADLAAVVEAEPPAVPSPVAAWGRHARGRIAEWRLLEDEDEILELEPAYVVRGPYRLWKDLLRRKADPLQAAVSGRLRVQGDLQALVKRANYRYVVDEALASVATEFPDEARR
ncbi:MAG TPA: SCP2 sterol-binding domain-containing protein [Anaeromyxobacteraceae bacterium]|nr:SCP2 sterol-binding domain-containing protein [Anaeromyxobacteraceae bacterium]